ncbi:MAG: helix-turn-helix domain-containing protein [Thiothrix sp.]|nr:helix-turn-helix domain-containing protein [Thiothrix sp.]HPQ97108.1 helix-turn-helix domain-containing protein [Thiolinea sp.]
MPTLHISFCLCTGLPMFALVSALEVLRHANRMSGQDAYRWSFLTEADTVVEDSNGLVLQPGLRLQEATRTDRVFVVAGFGAWELQVPQLQTWLRQQARRGVALGGISNGSFVLAQAGLLDGYTATAHWEDFSSFCERYPGVRARYQRYVIDGPRLSCCGGASTLDLMIEVVRRDLGADIARKVARQMLLDDYTPSATGPTLVCDGSHHHSPRLQRVLGLLEADLDGRMTVENLAHAVGLGRRELLRVVRRETGRTPRQLLGERRLERARSLVRHSTLALATVADATGFSSQSHLTQRYRETFGMTPAEDRRRHQGGPEY